MLPVFQQTKCLESRKKIYDVAFVADTLKQNIVPLVCKYCDQAVQSEERHLLSVVKNFGCFCHNLSGSFTKNLRF